VDFRRRFRFNARVITTDLAHAPADVVVGVDHIRVMGHCASAILFILALSLCCPAAAGQTFAQRLGWKLTDVAVILHVDDAGMSHSSNLGAIEAMGQGVATSCSVMMPCSWVSEMARHLKAHPDLDSGVHLTLTSEWQLYRWGPVAGKSQVPGLVDLEGCLWRSVQEVARSASPDEVEREMRAQVDRAETLGIPITHLDSHMGTLFARPDYFERFVKLGVEKKVPVLVVSSRAPHLTDRDRQAAQQLEPWVKKTWNSGLPVLDDLVTDYTSAKNETKIQHLIDVLGDLKPGVTEIIFHASKPTDEFPLITGSSAARGADLQALIAPEVKKFIQERGIILTTWKELKERRAKAAAME
jgi:chitin disaccharide deacetylase